MSPNFHYYYETENFTTLMIFYFRTESFKNLLIFLLFSGNSNFRVLLLIPGNAAVLVFAIFRQNTDKKIRRNIQIKLFFFA
jgi:hypothetical protein